MAKRRSSMVIRKCRCSGSSEISGTFTGTNSTYNPTLDAYSSGGQLHVNGQAARSCQTPMSGAAGKRITTIEGLAGAKAEHPLQKSWKAVNVPQCGYCQSGQIMQAAAMLKAKPKPTDQDIDKNMAGNIADVEPISESVKRSRSRQA
jgi:aerobic-type carbon monoxide dehydrogenase small subunit (CoxS/CutS family)